MNAEPLIVERTYSAPVHAVWQALTDKNKMKEWYFDISDFKPEVGFEFEFTANDGEKKFRHLCRITGVMPDKKLSYTWRYAEYPGNSEVTFELFDEGDKTRLVLTHTGLESFPADNSSFAKASFTGGWNHILGKSLPDFLAKK